MEYNPNKRKFWNCSNPILEIGIIWNQTTFHHQEKWSYSSEEEHLTPVWLWGPCWWHSSSKHFPKDPTGWRGSFIFKWIWFLHSIKATTWMRKSLKKTRQGFLKLVLSTSWWRPDCQKKKLLGQVSYLRHKKWILFWHRAASCTFM